MPNKFIWFPRKSHHGYFDKALGRHFSTKQEKRNFMNTHGLQEDGSMENHRKRNNRLYEIVMEEKEKKGLSTENKEEFLKGRDR